MTRILEFLFGLHSKNKDKEYVQGWYCWPDFMSRWHWPGYVRGEGKTVESRINPLYNFRTFICGLLTNHEISKTEWGTDGGEKIDCHCRWCDKVIKITPEEARFRFPTFNDWGRHLQFEEDDT